MLKPEASGFTNWDVPIRRPRMRCLQMLFNSFHFGLFLPVVFVLYWCMPHQFRWGILLLSSYYFYMSWNIKYVFLILLTTVISYGTALFLERTKNRQTQKLLLALALITNIGILFFFKYFNFFFTNVVTLLEQLAIPVHPATLNLLLPVGISFYTFQTLSYVIDVYHGNITAEKHFGIYATFISFFPQLVAGPIERTENLLPQIKKQHVFDYEQAVYGLRLMVWGYYKKIAIADNLAIHVDKIYNDPVSFSGFALILATILFSIQIYCDFSGYSDIARGTAKLMGIDLIENFKAPYFSASIKEFWSRWHISLSTWFRDYVYIPLGGNRVEKWKHLRNLIVTFSLSGLWHGANWTFILWGGIHGIAQASEHATDLHWKFHFPWLLRVVWVFVFCSFAWIFFRAENLHDAIYIIVHSLDGIRSPFQYLKTGLINTGLIAQNWNVLCWKLTQYFVFLLLPLGTYDYFSLKSDVIKDIDSMPAVIRWLLYMVAIFLLLAFLPEIAGGAFLYFQF